VSQWLKPEVSIMGTGLASSNGVIHDDRRPGASEWQ
jgi:hypothetical protein